MDVESHYLFVIITYKDFFFPGLNIPGLLTRPRAIFVAVQVEAGYPVMMEHVSRVLHLGDTLQTEHAPHPVPGARVQPHSGHPVFLLEVAGLGGRGEAELTKLTMSSVTIRHDQNIVGLVSAINEVRLDCAQIYHCCC